MNDWIKMKDDYQHDHDLRSAWYCFGYYMATKGLQLAYALYPHSEPELRACYDMGWGDAAQDGANGGKGI